MKESYPLSITEFPDFEGNTISAGSAEAQAAEKLARENDRGHVFHSWSAQAKINPLPIAYASGSWFYDYAGKGYLDSSSQLVSANLGHNHPQLVEAIESQLRRVTNVNPAFASDVRGALAEDLVKKAQGDFSHVFFTNGGADAVEHAIRMARKHTGKAKVLTAYRSYHGATGSAIMATGEARRHGNPTTDGDIKHFWGPFLYRSAFHATTEAEECERALQHLEDTIDFESDVAAILIESMVGSSGVIAPPAGYLEGVREICDRKGILWIADEVMVGFGRTGKFFAYEHGGEDLQPDLITFAKGVNAGIAPLGGVIMTEAIKSTFDETPYPGGLTYSGHPWPVPQAWQPCASMTARTSSPRLKSSRPASWHHSCARSLRSTRPSVKSADWASSGHSSSSAIRSPRLLLAPTRWVPWVRRSRKLACGQWFPAIVCISLPH